jgi:CubicO group peptidase (beta-lactamase class C family)
MSYLVAIFASLVAFAPNGLISALAATAPKDDEVERRIERVVNGLLPDTSFDNRYGPKASLQDRMAYFHTPGVSIAVVKNHRIEWARGFGVREWGKRAPVIETTLFQAGSVSKPIFALGVMRLVQEGKLNLDEDVNRYLTSWKIPAIGSWQPRITLRQILSHSAGLTVHGFPGYRTTEKLPTVVDILEGRPPSNTPRVEVNVVPGTEIRYSGGGITAAQQLVVDVLGQPFPAIMRNLVLDPLGMKQSTYEQPLPRSRAGSAATAHPWKYHPLEGSWHVYPEMAAAGLWTTPSDLARAGIELQKALEGESNRVLSAGTAKQMLTPGFDKQIGMGFFLAGIGKDVRFIHSGWDEGFVASMTFYKEAGMGAVIMVNSNEGNPLLGEVERAIAREYDWPGYFEESPKTVPVAVGLAGRLTGEYASKSGLRFLVSNKAGELFLKSGEQMPVALKAMSDSHFLVTGLNSELTFGSSTNGEIQSLTLHQDGRRITAERKR